MDTHLGLNNLDYIILGVILFSGLLALLRGFVREVLSLLSLIGAYFVAVKFYPLAEPLVHHYLKLKDHQTTAMAAGVVVFVLALLVFTLIGFLLAHLIRGRGLTAIDRSLGFVFGVLRGALVVSIIFLAVTSVEWPELYKTKPPQAPTLERPAPVQETKENADDKNQPPGWLIHAKLYPALTMSANVLRSFLPQKDLDKTDKQFQKEKAAVEKMINDKALEVLSTPSPAGANNTNQPQYNNQERNDLNSIVNQRASP